MMRWRLVGCCAAKSRTAEISPADLLCGASGHKLGGHALLQPRLMFPRGPEFRHGPSFPVAGEAVYLVLEVTAVVHSTFSPSHFLTKFAVWLQPNRSSGRT